MRQFNDLVGLDDQGVVGVGNSTAKPEKYLPCCKKKTAFSIDALCHL